MSASFRIRPFDFGEIFEIPDPIATDDTAGTADLRLRCAALEAELALARQMESEACAVARAEGLEAGAAQALEEQSAALLAATDALHAAVEAVEARLEEIEAETARAAAEVAQAAAELLAGRALEWAPVAAIDEAIGRVLRQIARGQEVQVRVHPELVPGVEAAIAARQATDRRRLALSVVGEAGLGPFDARIDWDQGGVTLDHAARIDATRAAFEPLLSPKTPVIEEEMLSPLNAM